MARDLEQEIRNFKKNWEAFRRIGMSSVYNHVVVIRRSGTKDAKNEDLGRRAAILRETIRDLTRKRQLLIFESDSGG